jgi:hypothetical protein
MDLEQHIELVNNYSKLFKIKSLFNVNKFNK